MEEARQLAFVMACTGWDIQRQPNSVQVARRGRTRLDVSVQTLLVASGKTRVAQEVRQDIWRAVQHQRGFSPIVQVSEGTDGLLVTAGGMIDDQKVTAKLVETLACVLADQKNRKRWSRHA